MVIRFAAGIAEWEVDEEEAGDSAMLDDVLTRTSKIEDFCRRRPGAKSQPLDDEPKAILRHNEVKYTLDIGM